MTEQRGRRHGSGLTDTVVASLLVLEKLDVSEDAFAEVAISPLDEDLSALELRLDFFILFAGQHWTDTVSALFVTAS